MCLYLSHVNAKPISICHAGIATSFVTLRELNNKVQFEAGGGRIDLFVPIGVDLVALLFYIRVDSGLKSWPTYCQDSISSQMTVVRHIITKLLLTDHPVMPSMLLTTFLNKP